LSPGFIPDFATALPTSAISLSRGQTGEDTALSAHTLS
jgi:hypothetical protein